MKLCIINFKKKIEKNNSFIDVQTYICSFISLYNPIETPSPFVKHDILEMCMCIRLSVCVCLCTCFDQKKNLNDKLL